MSASGTESGSRRRSPRPSQRDRACDRGQSARERVSSPRWQTFVAPFCAHRQRGGRKYRDAARRDATETRQRDARHGHDPLGPIRECESEKRWRVGEDVPRDLLSKRHAHDRRGDAEHQRVEQHHLHRRRAAVAFEDQVGDHEPSRGNGEQHRTEREQEADHRAEGGEHGRRLIRRLRCLAEQLRLEVGWPDVKLGAGKPPERSPDLRVTALLGQDEDAADPPRLTTQLLRVTEWCDADGLSTSAPI